MSLLKNTTALITGATSGIGYATALLFAHHGVNLSLTGRNSKQLNEMKTICIGINTSIKVVTTKADLCDESDVKKIVNKTLANFEELNSLINCAGIIEMGSIEDTSLEQFDRLMNINVRSIYNLCMKTVPSLIKSQGCIVNVSSVNGIRAFPGVLSYNISKAALDHLTRCMALELAPKQVRVNSVNPGVTVTNLHRRAGMTPQQYRDFLHRTKETHALGRAGRPEEVAETVAFLADGGRSGFITGETICVDGGRHAMCPR